MQFIPLLFLIFLQCVLSKNNVKSLTESMGQEVIEIGTPIKELPPGLEEEPSVERDEEDKSTTNTIQPATKRELKKPTTMGSPIDSRRKYKDMDKNTLTDKEKADDEEARIEKELAEIYKDNIDYKGDSSEVVKEVTPAKEPMKKLVDKPVGRSGKTNFKFQPNMNSKAEIERFRTSIDEISCGRINKLSAESTMKPKSDPGEGDGAPRNSYFLASVIPFVFLIFFK